MGGDYSFAGVDHVQLTAPPGCEEQARWFYGTVLGLAEVPKPAELAGRGGVWFDCGVHQVHIGVQPDFVPAAKAHPGFLVTGLARLQGRLEAEGIATREDVQLDGCTRFHASDPFGNRLEFLEKAAAGEAPAADSGEVRNLLYRRPELYELIYPEPDRATARMCQAMFQRYLPSAPGSILDIGCGTARDLEALAQNGAECLGVDLLPEVIDYARRVRPHLDLRVGDMRSLRLGRTFDAILCMGSALMYALTNEDVRATLATFAAHAHPGTLLILDLNNAASLLGPGFRETVRVEIERPEFRAVAVSQHSFDRAAQQLIRRRSWQLSDGATMEDYCRYRLFFPQELTALLEQRGFRVVGMFDNKELKATDLNGGRLYVAAVCESIE